MKFFIDTANIEEIKKGIAMGLVDGVTTNPSLLAKEKKDPDAVIREIMSIVEGPVSLEVIATDAGGMCEEARKLAALGTNAVIKIPMTEEGMKAVRILSQEGIKTNVTLIFQPIQALIAAKVGADYVSPFHWAFGRYIAARNGCCWRHHHHVLQLRIRDGDHCSEYQESSPCR